jgi:hypothetical protein
VRVSISGVSLTKSAKDLIAHAGRNFASGAHHEPLALGHAEAFHHAPLALLWPGLKHVGDRVQIAFETFGCVASKTYWMSQTHNSPCNSRFKIRSRFVSARALKYCSSSFMRPFLFIFILLFLQFVATARRQWEPQSARESTLRDLAEKEPEESADRLCDHHS